MDQEAAPDAQLFPRRLLLILSFSITSIQKSLDRIGNLDSVCPTNEKCLDRQRLMPLLPGLKTLQRG